MKRDGGPKTLQSKKKQRTKEKKIGPKAGNAKSQCGEVPASKKIGKREKKKGKERTHK